LALDTWSLTILFYHKIMFYECQKCKRRWQYPIAECPYCLMSLDKIGGKKATVRGAVKVAIPTLFHPDVPYNVLLLEDEAGNMWGYKSEKEYKAGDEFTVEADSDKNAVAIWRVKYEPREAIEKVLSLIGEVNIGAGSKVAVLPTITKPVHSYFRDNTSPEFLAALLQLLLDCGVKKENITVGTQSFDEVPAGAAAMKAGLVEACMKFGIMPLDLATGEFETIGQFEVSKPVLDADLVIDLAMEKMGAASATGNILKALKKECYLGQKYLSSDAEIAAKLEPVISKLVVIGEAEFIQRSNKLVAFTGLVLAGRAARNVDRVFNEVTKAFKLPEVLKDIDMAMIPIVGRTIKEVQYQAEIF